MLISIIRWNTRLGEIVFGWKKAKLIIADDGTQIPIGMNIFEPFVTENEARTSGKGTGLGLAITKYILDEHKAKIDICDTVPGYVKAFIVDFPIV